MTNEELLNLIKKDLGDISDYCLGLHNICMYKYKYFATTKGYTDLKLDKDDITEEDIARRILSAGLKVIKTYLGLTSTVMSFDHPLDPDIFNYVYNGNPLVNSHSTCNVIVARPNYISFQESKFFLGDLTQYDSVGNAVLFNRTLHPSFIYGYYTKAIKEEPKSIYSHKITFSNTLSLHRNPNFWSLLSEEEKEKKLTQIFRENKNVLKAIKLANNDSHLGLIFVPSKERKSIIETRKQRKELTLKK